MKIVNTVALAALALFATACGDKGKTTLSGKVDESTKEVVVSVIAPEALMPIDTVEVVDGEFEMELTLDSSDFILVQVSPTQRVPLFINPGEHVSFEMKGEDQKTYDISGSEESQRIARINEIMVNAMKEVDSLNALSQEPMGDQDALLARRAELNIVFKGLAEETSQKYKDMIDEQPGSIANIFIFSQTIGNMPLVSAQEDFEYFEKVGAGLQESYPNLSHTKNYIQRMEQMREDVARQKELAEINESIKSGSEIPEIALPDPDGDIKKLSDLRGKVVLVDFWAAWCRPCRAENPNLVRLYNEYKDKGFDVYSVSLDGLPNQQNPKEAWTGAIEQDGLVWENHVSDLQGWNSSVIQNFGFNGIPFTVLVDRNGKIIDTELRGATLEAKLKEIFGS